MIYYRRNPITVFTIILTVGFKHVKEKVDRFED